VKDIFISIVKSVAPATTEPAPPALIKYGVIVSVTKSFCGFRNVTPLFIGKLNNTFAEAATVATGKVNLGGKNAIFDI
jgi:hypothetical protein